MPEIAITYMPLSQIRLWAENPKEHDIGRLTLSFKRYGFVSPPTVNEATGVLLEGHGRYLALQAMKERGEAPPARIKVENGEWLVPVITGISLEALEAISYALDDNLSTMAGGDLSFPEVSRAFNDRKLAGILGQLAEQSALPVFVQEEGYEALLEAMLEVDGEGLEDQFDVEGALGADVEPRVRPGGLWQLGRQRLMCGDSTKATDVAKLMGGELARLVVTDPPYGVGLDPRRWGSWRRPIENDDLEGEELLSFLTTAFGTAACHTTEDASWYVWHASITRPIFLQALAAAGVQVHQELVWVKESFQLGYADYQWQHESCLYGWGKSHNFYGERNQSTVWEVARESGGIHPARKPVELFARPMRNNLRRGELALDMFLGSGTALIAAEELGRRCYGMEVDPLYCEVAIRRWESLTGQEAKLVRERAEDMEGW